MRIAQITPGAAGMLCGSCLHDNTLARALIRQGHDVSLVPIYTPIRTDEEDVSLDRIFYGAINVYLEQKSFLFRHTPKVLHRMLDNPKLLGWASGRGVSIDPGELGAMTLSMLQGEHGKQRQELAALVAWLRDELRPEIVHLSNSLLLGMAGQIRRELNVPVLCSVQGEDIFLDELHEPYRARVQDTMRERARDVDGFVANSRYYVDYMSDWLGLSAARMHHVPLGISLEGFEQEPQEPSAPFNIGYLARICPEKGLHVLTHAFRELVGQDGGQDVRLSIAGYLGARDQAYFEATMAELRSWGLEGRVDYLGEVDRGQKLDLLRSLHVLSVPTPYREPKGLFVLEALAAGVPVVQPDHGAFPELIEATGGGLLVEPNSPSALAAAFAELKRDPARRRALGRSGRQAVFGERSDEAMARATLEVYRRYVPDAAQA